MDFLIFVLIPFVFLLMPFYSSAKVFAENADIYKILPNGENEWMVKRYMPDFFLSDTFGYQIVRDIKGEIIKFETPELAKTAIDEWKIKNQKVRTHTNQKAIDY